MTIRPSISLLVVVLLAGLSSGRALGASHEGHAKATPAEPASEPPAPPPSTDGTKAPEGTGGKSFDFNFFGDEAAKGQNGKGTDVSRESDEVAAQASRRRWMLKVHQTLGLATWALMAATVTVGQLNYNELYGGGGGSKKYQGPHAILVGSTTLAFAGTGAFALLAPKPYSRPLKLDTGLIHRIAVIGATLGMVSEIVLGVTTGRRADAGNQRSLASLARAHQIIGYSTFGMLTVAATVWVF